MSTINQDQVLCLHNQVQNIIRYFSQSFFAEQATAKIYRLVGKMNRVRGLAELTINQYNTTMHHLRRLEHAGYLYELARYSIERELLQQMLECNIITNEREYIRPEPMSQEIDMVQSNAEAIINFDKLFTLI